MQKSIFQKVMPGIIPIILLATGVWFLFKMGMEPVWAAIAVIIRVGTSYGQPVHIGFYLNPILDKSGKTDREKIVELFNIL
jgi:hypothetical protein